MLPEKKLFIVVSIILVIVSIVLLFPAHSFKGLDLLKRIEGYHLEDDYQIDSLSVDTSLFPGMYLTQITKIDTTNSTAQVITDIDIAEKYKFKFEIGNAVTLYTLDQRLDKSELMGKIISIDKNYISKDYGPSIKYEISLDLKYQSLNDLKLLNLARYGAGSIVNSSEDGYAPVIDEFAIREINGKQYVCVVTDTIKQNQFFEGYTTIIKFELKQIQTGQKVYTLYGSGRFMEVTDGITSNEKILIGRYKSKTDVSQRTADFDCGKVQ